MIKKRQLGESDLWVSEIGMGTMNFGRDVDAKIARKLLSLAVEYGVNLIDTAETYPYPPAQDSYGESEKIISHWLRETKLRDQITIVSKIAGPSSHLPFLRSGHLSFDKPNIATWIDQTLQRLGIEYLDVALLHWPERATNTLGQLDYKPAHKEPDPRSALAAMEGALDALNDTVLAGKIRYIGLSNETPWGVMSFLNLADKLDLEKIVVVQNRYHLLDRSFDIGLAEIVERESLGFMAYSPLAFGLLSAKYSPQAGAQENSRLHASKKMHPYLKATSTAAAAKYHSLATQYGVDIAQMAIAYLLSRRYVSCVLVGASSEQQLTHNLSSNDLHLEKKLITAIDKIHRQHPNPCL